MAEVFPTDTQVQMEFSTGVWTEISEDLHMADPIIAKYGIRGVGPMERLGHAGTLPFALDNSDGNSGAAQGYYSPGHANVRSGFGVGVGTRIRFDYGGSTYYKWRGRIKGIHPESGVKGLRVTHIEAQDWIAAASEIKPQLLEVQENKDGGALITALLAAIDDDPPATDLDTGISTFPYTWDEVRDGNTTVYEILRGIAISELGYVIQIGDTSQGGTLQFENRHARVKETSVLVTLDDDGDDDDLAGLTVEDNLGNIFNVIRAEAYPRVIDNTADQVLWTLQGDAPTINAGETIEIVGKYTDPDQRVSRVAGLDLQDPEGKNELVEQGAATDRSFEDGVGDWVAGGTGVTVAASADQAKKGSQSLKLDSGTNGAVQPTAITDLLTGVVQNDILYYQIYLYVDDTWQDDLEIILEEYDSSDVIGTTQTLESGISTPDAQWVRYAGTVTIQDADAAKCKIGIRASASGDYSGGAVQAYVDECYLIHDSELNYTSSGAEEDLELIDSEMGGNSSKFVVKNLGAGSITLDNIQAIGKRALIYQPALALADDATSKASYGERPLSMGLLYQDDPLEAQDFADITLSRWKDAAPRIRSVSFWANRSDTLMTAFLQGEPGKRVAVKETVTGIDAEYFINGVEFQIYPPLDEAKIHVTWYLSDAGGESYWILGSSQLGSGTVLGF